MNYSKQRETILNFLKNNHTHPSADEVFQEIRPLLPNVSLATVYRNLNLLVELGEIRKIESLDGTARFDFNVKEHYHFVCTNCNKVYDVPAEVVSGLDQKAELLTGFKIEKHDISFKGICCNCLKK